MRMDQSKNDYLAAEQRADYEWCWQKLLSTLNKYRATPAASRRRAQRLWSELAWPADNKIRSFHTIFRRAMMACERHHVERSEHDVVLKYLDLLPSETALYLEDPLRRPSEGWKPDDMMKACEDFYELREVYSANRNDGMLRHGGRNRATWANDDKMMKVPLGQRAPPLHPSAGGGGGGGGGGPATCGKCGGKQHLHEKCPNTTASQDKAWLKKP